MSHLQLDASVIVATYNQLGSTSLALQALFAQSTHCRYEVLVCDDGSDADTIGALRDTLQAAPVPTRLVWQQDRGFRLAASRNNGIRLARGRVLIFLDGDLMPERDFVEKHMLAHQHDHVIAVGKRLWRSPDAIPTSAATMEALWAFLRTEEATDRRSRFMEATELLYRHYLWKLQPWMTCYGCNISIAKSPLVEFDESFVDWGNEDYDLFYGLNVVHDHEITLTDAIAYEVEAKEKCWQPSDFAAHLRSGLRFFDKWTHTGLKAPYAVPRYELDPETKHLRRSRQPVHGWKPEANPGYVEAARAWLQEDGRDASNAGDTRARQRTGPDSLG